MQCRWYGSQSEAMSDGIVITMPQITLEHFPPERVQALVGLIEAGNAPTSLRALLGRRHHGNPGAVSRPDPHRIHGRLRALSERP